MVVPAAHCRLITFESELRVMASRSCRPDGCEDGFDLWGYYTRGGRQFIHLVTVSGPGSARSPTRYVGDLSFFRHNYKHLSECYGCACLGWGHDHHILGLDQPSSADTRSTMSLTRRNRFCRWCEIITTAEAVVERPLWSFSRSVTPLQRIRLNAYSYLDPQQGSYVRTQLLVLPGISPLRLALAHRREIPIEALGEDGLYFPLSHIVYDAYTGMDSGDIEPEPDVEELSRQCRELPEALQESLGVEGENDAISVSVQLSGEHGLTIHYARTPELRIESVALHCRNVEPAYDLPPNLMGLAARRPLNRICRYALAWIKRGHGVQKGNRYSRGCVDRRDVDGLKSAANVPPSKEISDACETHNTGS